MRAATHFHQPIIYAKLGSSQLLEDFYLPLLYRLIVTADHGNCEQMYDPVHQCPHTSHTLNDVWLILVDERFKKMQLRADGRLGDIAPTLLELMGLEVPPEMSGGSLLRKE